MNLLNLTEHEWEEAEVFFNKKENKEKVKYSRKLFTRSLTKEKHSFIKINKPDGEGYEIYAMANSHLPQEKYSAHLGEGAFGKVKIVQNRLGQNFALKVEGLGPRLKEEPEYKVMKYLDYAKGDASRPYEGNKMFLRRNINQKRYTVTRLIPGKELFKYLYMNTNGQQKTSLSPKQRILIALRCCQAVQALHQKNIIHGDIKPKNFMAKIEGGNMLIECIDFGFSLLIPEHFNSIQLNEIRGTPRYLAPEIYQNCLYSFSSDIYALGKLFTDDLDLQEDPNIKKLIDNMLCLSANKRPTIEEIISILEKTAKKHKIRTEFLIEKENPDHSNPIFSKLSTWLFPKKKPESTESILFESNHKSFTPGLQYYFNQPQGGTEPETPKIPETNHIAQKLNKI